MWRFLSIVFNLKRTHQLSLLPDKDLVNLCPPIEPYQVTKSQSFQTPPLSSYPLVRSFLTKREET
ncbi:MULTISPECIES: hypothetical protein [Microcystis]|uniref:hypothetical protein n=1 Tax=Microcystis TaxID=1125 RepID=UPI001E5F17B0|nr:hypothetical protein [Microcystis aeruginosa]UGS11392.1 hypothetical protein LRR78_12960 [Microcystis aeruginosa FACHB-905 = DIANCHI905]WKX64539.1 hypothetical protein Q3H53_004752 [Microcystis aeruginosa PCC 7806]